MLSGAITLRLLATASHKVPRAVRPTPTVRRRHSQRAMASMATPGAHPVSSSQTPTHSSPNASNQAPSVLSQGADPNAKIKEAKAKMPNASKKEKSVEAITASMGRLEMDPPAEYLARRLALFEQLKAEQDAELKNKAKEVIEITLPSGDVKKGTSYETSPMSIALDISKGLAEKTVIAKVDGDLWDLERPLEKSCKLELLDFESKEGKNVFWHSSAHILGEAAERHYGCHLCIGPPTDEGFFYEMALPDGRTVATSDLAPLETLAKKVVSEKQPFERLTVSKENLLKMFEYNRFKTHIINDKIPDGTSTTVYRCGPMIDLCRGPHVPHTGKVKSMALLKNSASYFLGKQENEQLQRIYGISFPDAKQMKEYKIFLEEAAKRDHRRIGTDQELFFFHNMSPGSCFWLPHGTRIYNTLVDFIKSEYRKRGYSEVISPNMFSNELWKTSGHWQNYKDDMFTLNVEKQEWALKPMNCPGHCLIFGSRERSYKELPIRMADFGVLHRNEASGALSGLTRVRRFQQDDAHHFCTTEQIEDEVAAIFDFVKHVYGLFGFTFHMELSTMPDNHLGDVATWQKAEGMLSAALNKFAPGQWEENPGDGAFYGPKIDITLSDALKRRHQCSTIQLDFQLPSQFKLAFHNGKTPNTTEKVAEGALPADRERPVMIHRAIMGSVERFVAILTEHFAGRWPFWLSPRQILVIPVAAPHKAYATEVAKMLWDAGLYADADMTDATLPKKIRNGETSHYNFLLVVGSDEMDGRSVNIRNRDDIGAKGRTETLPLEDAVSRFVALKTERRLENRI
ncbi:uncharacterized protein L969DRAFT_88382 [Mixia osmundae IAM 14324]|uniref:Probable threonine--tRNA ligase, cytoplasmic n=1 Tax=Mixia osmundae (strain CBS 9802 / IAM 14324 / JCM 22182 / KY 12970) TaxID=764103 RepID=G7E718_MIXOS|nr:uncharacterized protein L969DRAFT_88382 [Mixia osmundae IAM 14324]KEI38990.1 hypothetical protein L969DRAFT_88382 [Mixia osmundae IAM 14324]GAA98628.1 hypothetical protein E5Q_05315 [Mixia osmundae IAM 14324]